MKNQKPEVLFITSYPPRECGIATYSQDLIQAIDNKFGNTFSIQICALETLDETYSYSENVKFVLNTINGNEYSEIADKINSDIAIKMVVIQHEFGFFELDKGSYFLAFLERLMKPIILGFHTILPTPNNHLKSMVIQMANTSKSIIVMTHASKNVLVQEYEIAEEKIKVIPHGTHLVSNANKTSLKKKYGLVGRKVLSTFGLISSGKSFETTLYALPEIIKTNPEIMFLIIGKTHPGVIKHEGEAYRNMLQEKVKELHLEDNVQFINQYLSLPILLEYLRLTDIYLFTSKDPNQAVSGTFSYAMSCGCPIISTPIPQAREMLDESTGIIIAFLNSDQLAKGVKRLLNKEGLRKEISIHTLHKIAPTAWENSAIAHSKLFIKTMYKKWDLVYNLPPYNLLHIKQLTNKFGMFQFSKINQPDTTSGYTLDDNARAMIAVCMHYEATKERADLDLLNIYIHFIKYCIQPNGSFLNYVDTNKEFTQQNFETNLEDSNGRAIWALGYIVSQKSILPIKIYVIAEELLIIASQNIANMYSSRAMAFSIKGLYYFSQVNKSESVIDIIETLADRLVQMYEHEAEEKWNWFESYLTYANSILPEAMLLASLIKQKPQYLEIAKESFHFLLSQTFNDREIKVISNKSWLSKGGERAIFGEQPIDVSYTILAIHTFYENTKDSDFLHKMRIAFNWFLGNNHLNQIIYNPCTGGCYDGLEEHQVNLNQGAESTVSYLMARMTVEKYNKM